jgi:DNA helicase-2/ATP-dependent DNA helicase PcrA
MDESELLKGLNEEQKRAVTHAEGPLIIVAGAGTGKTTVITRRIAWLVATKRAKPEQLLALTFTDKAAGEMEERVDLLLPYGYADLQISTFHAFCERLLRDYGVEIGLPRDFRLANELDAWLLARKNFDRFELELFRPRGNPTKYLRSLLTHFSRAKDSAIPPERYLAFSEEKSADTDATDAVEDASRVKELANAYHAYQRILLENDALDFGDLLLYSLELLRTRPKVLEAVRKRYRYVLVDEFQDTNAAQYELVKLIAAPSNNLTVVGDDDQSIYAFRGASLANILQFETDYSASARVVLTHNYRSVQTILDKAHAFIQANNPNRLEARAGGGLSKRLKSAREDEGFVGHIHASTAEEEAAAVARTIAELKAAHPEVSWNDFGILVRGNDAAGPFLSALDRRGIPYQFLALRGLYGKPIILDLVALLRIIENPHDSPSFYRAMTHPLREIPNEAVVALNMLAQRKGKSLYEAACMASLAGLPAESLARIDAFLGLCERLRQESRKRPASELFVHAAKEGSYVAHVYAQGDADRRESFGHLQKFYERIKAFEAAGGDASLREFLAEFALERDSGEEGALGLDLDSGPELVRVMTVHSSKGLEFRFVFVVNLVDRRFPSQARAEAIPLPDGLVPTALVSENGHLEEERRLFYVAMTRAKERLYFTSADRYGGPRERKLSRFLGELGLEKPGKGTETKEPGFLSEAPAPSTDPVGKPFVIRLPKQYSFTQLTAFRTCPLQYKFAHVLKIPVFGRWTLSFGKTMHNTLQAFFEDWTQRIGARQGTLFAPTGVAAETIPVTLEELLKTYQERWIDDWYQNDRQREEYRKKGREILVGYFKGLEAAPPKPLMLEQPFTLKFGSEVVVKGRIDRIDRFEDGVEIIDYKTGNPKTAETMERGDKEQLMLYQIAARDVLGLVPRKLTYVYLENQTSVSFLGTDEDLLKLSETVLERVRAIRESVFDPTPGFHCQYCDFRDICKFRSS